MTRPLIGVTAALALVVAGAGPAAAQARPSTPLRAGRAPSTPRIEVGVGGGAARGIALGDGDATLLSNNTSGSAFRLFTAATRLQPAPFIDVQLGYHLTPRLMAEGRLTMGRPDLRVSLSADAESAPSLDATSRLTEYVVEGGGVWRFSTDARRRWTPFVSGGAGVVRHVYDGRALVENAVDGYVGGGALYALGSRRAPVRVSRTGLRFDARLQLISGGIADGAGVSPRASASAGLFIRF